MGALLEWLAAGGWRLAEAAGGWRPAEAAGGWRPATRGRLAAGGRLAEELYS